MKSTHKNLIRAVVLAAIFAWPAVESYNYYVAKQQVAESQVLLEKVNKQLALCRQKHKPEVLKASLKVE